MSAASRSTNQPESARKPAGVETRVNPQTQARIAQQLAGLPLSFEPNQGQSSAATKFMAHGNGFSIFLTGDETVLALPGKKEQRQAVLPISSQLIRPEDAAPVELLRMKLIGANNSASLSGIDQLPGWSNYFIGPPDQWRTGVPTFRRVIERNVYKGIDFVYYSDPA